MKQSPRFTHFNILRSDDSRTMPDQKLLFEQGELFQAVSGTISDYFPDPKNIKIADLGCLEGGYAIGLARQGYEVLGIDARRDNIDKCIYAAEGLGLSGLRFVTDDVRNLAKYGQFDVILCSGLLYHFDTPKKLLASMSKATKKMLIVNTHYALDHDPLYDPSDEGVSVSGKVNFALSPLSTNEGLRGRWYTEFQPETSEEDIQNSPWAAFGNRQSFWIVKEDLLRAIKDVGFSRVYEDQYDFLNKNTIAQYDRSIFVALK